MSPGLPIAVGTDVLKYFEGHGMFHGVVTEYVLRCAPPDPTRPAPRCFSRFEHTILIHVLGFERTAFYTELLHHLR